MQIEIDPNSGFCHGVTTAIRKAENELGGDASLFCLGDIVHNESEVERLRALGLITIDHDQFATLHDARVLLRAHGEPPEVYNQAQRNNISLVDATCPVVLQLQRRIKAIHQQHPDAQIVIYGKPGHAEVVGLVGQTGGQAIVVQTPEEAAALNFERDIFLFSQTTMPLDGFHEIISLINQSIQPAANFQYFDTICRQVANRLPRIQAFAAQHDVVIFVAGRGSSNGHMLYDACLNVNPRTHSVDSPAALRAEWFRNAQTVGICGATSTPTWLMEQCRQRIREMGEPSSENN